MRSLGREYCSIVFTSYSGSLAVCHKQGFLTLQNHHSSWNPTPKSTSKSNNNFQQPPAKVVASEELPRDG